MFSCLKTILEYFSVKKTSSICLLFIKSECFQTILKLINFFLLILPFPGPPHYYHYQGPSIKFQIFDPRSHPTCTSYHLNKVWFLDHLNIPISKHVIHVTFNLMDFSNFSCQSLGLVNMKQINLPAIFPSPSVSKVRRCTWSFKLGDKKPWCLNQLETGPVTQKNNWCCLHSLTTFNNKFRHAYKINFCQC